MLKQRKGFPPRSSPEESLDCNAFLSGDRIYSNRIHSPRTSFFDCCPGSFRSGGAPGYLLTFATALATVCASFFNPMIDVRIYIPQSTEATGNLSMLKIPYVKMAWSMLDYPAASDTIFDLASDVKGRFVPMEEPERLILKTSMIILRGFASFVWLINYGISI